MGFFSFSNWGANDVILVNGNSDNNYFSGSYENETFRGGDGNDQYDIRPDDIVDETGTDGVDTVHSYWSVSLLSPNIRGDVENVFLTGRMPPRPAMPWPTHLWAAGETTSSTD